MLHLFLDNRPWFKPKLYGLGAFPATWQGWALTLAYVGVMGGLGVMQDGAPDALWWTIVSIATLVFVAIAWLKTEGGWRWRWGREPTDTHESARHKRPRNNHRKPGA